MTNEHDPMDENIPELISDLEGSLNTPDPAAIRAGLSARQALHRRILSSAGAFVAVLVLVGGVFAITRDNDATTTETAADDSVFENLSSQIQRTPAVAEDSAPIELEAPVKSSPVESDAILANAPENDRSTPIDTVEIPDVAGLEFAAALDQLVVADFRTFREDEVSTSVPSGVIIRTDPPAGTIVGTLTGQPTVTIFVSSGPPPETTTPRRTPPTFSSSADVQLSGAWTAVAIWQDSTSLGLSSFNGRVPRISIWGREFGDSDGCNGSGGGVFLRRADGRATTRTGITTLVGCEETPSRSAYYAATRGEIQWGLTVSGNLVLANGDALVEFVKTEEAAFESPLGITLPFNSVFDFRTSGSRSDGNEGILLTIGQSETQLTVAGCDTFEFESTLGAGGEGAAAFQLVSGDIEACATEDAAAAVEALTEADYYAYSSRGDLVLWDGETALAAFTDMDIYRDSFDQ